MSHEEFTLVTFVVFIFLAIGGGMIEVKGEHSFLSTFALGFALYITLACFTIAITDEIKLTRESCIVYIEKE